MAINAAFYGPQQPWDLKNTRFRALNRAIPETGGSLSLGMVLMVPTDGARLLMLGTCFVRIVDPSVVLQSRHEPFAHSLTGSITTIFEQFEVRRAKWQKSRPHETSNGNEMS